MSKKKFKKIGIRTGLAVGTGGLSEGVRAGKKLASGDLVGAVTDASGAGIIKDSLKKGQPDVPGLPTAPTLEDPTLDQAADEEELKRKRRANIATRPLGVLVQQALQTRTLTGQ